MQRFVQRTVWGGVWMVALGITAALCIQLAGTQPVMLAMVLLAVCVESVGFLYAARCWSAGNRFAAAVSFSIGLLGLFVSVASEVSYWTSTVDAMHRQAERERSEASAFDMVTERRRERLKQLTTGKSPEQIEAEMRAALTLRYGETTLGAVTRDCTNSNSPAYRHCTGYLALAAELAKAKEANRLEGAVIASGTAVVETAVLRSFYDFAKVASSYAGGSVEAWSVAVVALIVAFIQSLLCGGLFVGFAPQRRQEAPGAPKTIPDADAGLIVVPPAAPPALRVEAPVPALPDVSAWREDLKRKPADAVVLHSNDVGQPESDRLQTADEGDRLHSDATPDPSPAAPAIGPHLAYSADDTPRPLTKGEKRAVKKNTLASPDEDAERKTVELWAAECLSARPDRKNPPSSGDCHASLLAYCERECVAPVDQVRMTQILTEILKPVKVKGRYPRNALGRIWPGWRLEMPAAGRLRASA
jgi:hypothetical protein